KLSNVRLTNKQKRAIIEDEAIDREQTAIKKLKKILKLLD
ncbi:5376_t:CDS:1, partial [Dentiscutata erythropus]